MKGCDTAGTLEHEYATIRSLDRAARVPRIVPPLCVSAPRDRACLGYGVSALLPVVRVSGYAARLDGAARGEVLVTGPLCGSPVCFVKAEKTV